MKRKDTYKIIAVRSLFAILSIIATSIIIPTQIKESFSNVTLFLLLTINLIMSNIVLAEAFELDRDVAYMSIPAPIVALYATRQNLIKSGVLVVIVIIIDCIISYQLHKFITDDFPITIDDVEIEEDYEEFYEDIEPAELNESEVLDDVEEPEQIKVSDILKSKHISSLKKEQ